MGGFFLIVSGLGMGGGSDVAPPDVFIGIRLDATILVRLTGEVTMNRRGEESVAMDTLLSRGVLIP